MKAKEIMLKTSAYTSMFFAGVYGSLLFAVPVHASETKKPIDYFEASPLISNKNEPLFIENKEIIYQNTNIIENKITPEKDITPKEIRDYEKDLGVTVIENKNVNPNDRYGNKDEHYYISNATDVYTSDDEKSEVIGHLEYSDYIHCIGIDKENITDWIKIDYNDSIGYIKNNCITEEMLFSENKKTMYAKEDVQTYNDITLKEEKIQIHKSDKVNIVGESNSLYKIEYNNEYLYADKNLFDETPPYYKANNISFNSDNAGDSEIVNATLKYVGHQYVWGGTSPSGFDCSGLMQYVFNEYGIHINRVASDQARNGIGISVNEMQPGDLIFWTGDGANITHVSMYIGNGQMVHAANPSLGVIVSSVNSWSGNIVCVRRIR